MIDVKIKIKPLSDNRLWAGRRFKTLDYLAYEEELLLKLPKRKTIKGFVDVEIDLHLKNFKASDVSNFQKALLDILVKAHYIEDDRKILKLIVKKWPTEEDNLQIKIAPSTQTSLS